MNEDVLFVIAKDGAPIFIQIYGVSLFVASLEAENYSSSIFSCLPQFFTVAKFMEIIQISLKSGGQLPYRRGDNIWNDKRLRKGIICYNSFAW